MDRSTAAGLMLGYSQTRTPLIQCAQLTTLTGRALIKKAGDGQSPDANHSVLQKSLETPNVCQKSRFPREF
jgi:hypothetical protein